MYTRENKVKGDVFGLLFVLSNQVIKRIFLCEIGICVFVRKTIVLIRKKTLDYLDKKRDNRKIKFD